MCVCVCVCVCVCMGVCTCVPHVHVRVDVYLFFIKAGHIWHIDVHSEGLLTTKEIIKFSIVVFLTALAHIQMHISLL